jgi:hypothetical protein
MTVYTSRISLDREIGQDGWDSTQTELSHGVTLSQMSSVVIKIHQTLECVSLLAKTKQNIRSGNETSMF